MCCCACVVVSVCVFSIKMQLSVCVLYRMREAMDELAPGNGIVMKLSTDGSGRGAAVVAAVACRLQNTQ